MSFQAAASQQGGQFADQCDAALRSVGYTLQGKAVFKSIGVEVDQVATSKAGQQIWFEYKGSVRGNRPGLRRTDTVKKAICNGALLATLHDPRPYIVLTSHMPEKGAALAMINTAVAAGLLDGVVCIYHPGWERRLP